MHDIEVDEISLVDRPANQHAALLIAKRAEGAEMGEENEPDVVYTLDGQPVTALSELVEGQQVVDADGNRFTYVLDEEPDETNLEETDSPFLSGAGQVTVGKSLAETFRAELAKAQTGSDVSQLIAKMSTTLAVADQRLSVAEERAEQAELLAKSEQDLRLTAAYISKAAELSLPVDPTELGPVLMRMEQQMSHEDCLVVSKVLSAAGQMLFTEMGYHGGGGEEQDPMALAKAAAADRIATGEISEADALEEFYVANPGAYADYLANTR